MTDKVLDINILTIYNHRCKLKDLCFKNRHKTIYSTLPARLKKETEYEN